MILSGQIDVFVVRQGNRATQDINLNALTGPYSIIEELQPGDILAADLDFNLPDPEATGTYQVEM